MGDQEVSNILDIPSIQSLMDDFHKLTGMGMALLDLKGTVLVATGWQDLCVRYHRVHPQTARNCMESDLFLGQDVKQGDYLAYKCKNQLWDVVTPLLIGGKHIANIFTGQFFYENEAIDVGFFAAQAAKYGFDLGPYLEALHRVPRFNRDRIKTLMDFLIKFSTLISKLSYGNLKLAKAVSHQKSSEEEVRQLNAELEQRVRERTAQLEAAIKELEAFSYSVSHDLRAPLRHLTGFVNLLNKHAPEALDEKSRHYVTVISDSAIQMGRLIDDILSFSRMGRAEMTKTLVNMERLLKEVLKMFQQDLEGRDIAWGVGRLPEVYGDPAMLRMVLVNLVSNAIKFTNRKPHATIEIGHIPDDAGEEVLYIKDNGAGFDMRYVDRLFGLFQRLHSMGEFEGTGLGLANIQRIIHRHGGRTWAEGAVGQGATFFFSLPKERKG
jgi:signal transduction histidine kinase